MSLVTDPFYPNIAVTDYADPFLSNVVDMKSYVGRPRMNIDMSEKEDHYCVCVDLPGFLKDDININIDNNVLTIAAFKKECHEGDKGVHYMRRERAWGKCTRHLRLPSNLNQEKAETTFVNGVLIIKLPKITTSTTHKHLSIA